jgi:outer membrane protein assembly factor BamB
MAGRLEVRRWLRLGAPLYAVALSSDGQFVAVGSEKGPLLFNVAGEMVLAPSAHQIALPVRQVALSPAADCLSVGTRTGKVLQLALERSDGQFAVRQVESLYTANNDIHTMSVSDDQQWIAVGHLSPALSVLNAEGQIQWRRHSDDGTATEGDNWSVAIDFTGQSMYVGSAGAGSNRLAAIGLTDQRLYGSRYLAPGLRATALAALNDGMVVVQTDSASIDSELVKFTPDLSDLVWRFAPEDTVTALATPTGDAAKAATAALAAVACGYEGRVMLLDAGNGAIMAETTLRVGVNALALAQGRVVAAVTQDDALALLHYVPEEFRL